MEKLVTLSATFSNVGEMLSSSLVSERSNNQHCLLKILSSLKFLTRQGCAIRGRDQSDNTGNEGNLMQLIKLISEDDSTVCELCLSDKAYFTF